jgi:hypothetical protein
MTYYTNMEELSSFVEDVRESRLDCNHTALIRSLDTIGGMSQFGYPTTTVCLENASDLEINKAESMVKSLLARTDWICPHIIKTPSSGCPVCSQGGGPLEEMESQQAISPADRVTEGVVSVEGPVEASTGVQKVRHKSMRQSLLELRRTFRK